MLTKITPAVCAFCALWTCLFSAGCSSVEDDEMDAALEAAMNTTPFFMPAVKNPAAKAVTEATLDADSRVLGVVVNGQARAYSIDRLSQISDHVICDELGGSRIAVTYCDRTDCARALKLGEGDVVTVGGFKDGAMQIVHEDRSYNQLSPEIPLSDLECATVTWEQWLSSHSDSTVVENGWNTGG